MTKFTELALGDDGGAGPGTSSQQDAFAHSSPSTSASTSTASDTAASVDAAARSAALATQLGISDAPPPWWSQQLNRVSSLVFNGGIVALVRAWVNPPKLEVPSEGGSVPEWYAAEWAERTRWRRLGNQVARDTAALAGVMLLMDGVEAGMRSVRGGQDDPWNRVMGGVSAGGILGLMWYPGGANPRGRAYMTAAGSFVGYFSYVAERAVDASLLNTQRALEKELLEKPEDALRAQLNRPYLQSLLRAKQRQMREAAQREVAERVRREQSGLAADSTRQQQQHQLPAGAGAVDDGSGGGIGGGDGPYGGGAGEEMGSAAQSSVSEQSGSTASLSGGGHMASSSGSSSSLRSGGSGRIITAAAAAGGGGGGRGGSVGYSGSGSSSSDMGASDKGVLVITEEEDGDGAGDGDGAAGGADGRRRW
ncbi:hypothetical protein PLESTB_001652100 [Pleodorina starrii]|uniref:Uncharacterized protein n=1 Tax=Pleodorina starrii TaxID=330485 RepID=A0A9W6BYS1_9CHLO|nr:hypothetical protein PLESTM_000869000 [Pleodorina starrii]GLC60649.1 hypothetical protein PLESTB_001652100 [Pleodorina starrii]GLC68906.1 hypothetical protein PLESTF_000756600 [Pleodorina starrii]